MKPTNTKLTCRVSPHSDQEWWIDAPDGDQDLGHVQWEMLAVVYGCDDMGADGEAKAEANAKGLVKAFNFHNRLVHALQSIQDDIMDTGDIGYSSCDTMDFVLAELRAGQ